MKEESEMKLSDIKNKLTDKQLNVLAVVLFLSGILLLFSPKDDDLPSEGIPAAEDAASYRSALESRLTGMLECVEGVGEVKVMITLKGENSRTIAYNENHSVSVSDSSNREDTSRDAVLVRGDSGSVPFTVSENYPEVAGVLVVSSGAGDSLCRSYIISAVSATLGVRPNNITVLPMKSE